MNMLVLSGSKIGSKTRTAMNETYRAAISRYPEENMTFIDLADYDIQFSDGRDYHEYEGDTKYVAEAVMAADALIIGTPIFQAAIPAPLKNVFDLLPIDALQDKITGIVVTAGTPKHFLIAEQQLKPILGYMKAHIVQTYVFVEGKDFAGQSIINEDVLARIDQLVEDTMTLTSSYGQVREAKHGHLHE